MSDTTTTDLVPIGFIRAAQGLQGAMLVHAWSGSSESLVSYGPLMDATGKETYRFTIHGVKDKDFICRLANVTDRNQAEAMRGIKLFVPADRLPPTDEDEFYYRDLIGLRVENSDGQTIGVVRNVMDLAHGDVLSIEFTDRDPHQTELLLFTKQNVPFISIKEKRIVIDVPHGMFDTADAEQS